MIDLYLTDLADTDLTPALPDRPDSRQSETLKRENFAIALQQSWLNDRERQQVRRLHFFSDQRLALTSKQLTRWALSRLVGSPPEALVFGYGKHGKPFLVDYPELHFNLSHTGQQIIVAVSSAGDMERLGIDAEIPHPARGSYKLAKRFFSERETAQLSDCLPWQAEDQQFFCQLWTLKEAFIKALGRGLSLSLQTFGFEISQTGAIDFHCSKDVEAGLVPWSFASYRHRNNMMIGLAYQSQSKEQPVCWHTCKPVDEANGFMLESLNDEGAPRLLARSLA